jgi:hypothetical protein
MFISLIIALGAFVLSAVIGGVGAVVYGGVESAKGKTYCRP